MCIQLKPAVASKNTCVFVSIRENATQVKRVSKKRVSVLVKPIQNSEKATVTSKLKFVNASTQTDDKIHVGCHDVATLTENMFPECPERKHCDPDFLADSFLSSEIDDLLDESFKVDDLETSDDDYESQDEDNERISSSCKFIVFWGMLSQLLIFCFECRKVAHIENIY